MWWARSGGLAVPCSICKGPKATKEAWALASSLWGLLSSELAYPVVASVFVIRWSFLGLVIVAVPTRKDNYTKPILVCQGDLARFCGAISPLFRSHVRSPGRPVPCALKYYTKAIWLCQGDLHVRSHTYILNDKPGGHGMLIGYWYYV
jgi:hypothetical protein